MAEDKGVSNASTTPNAGSCLFSESTWEEKKNGKRQGVCMCREWITGSGEKQAL